MNSQAKIQAALSKSSAPVSNIQIIHDILMERYGWIPLEEFRQLPIPTVMSLLDTIKYVEKEKSKAMKNKTRKGRR